MTDSDLEEHDRRSALPSGLPGPPRRPVTLVCGVILMVLICALSVVLGILFTRDAVAHGDEEGSVAGVIAIVIGVVDLILAVLVWAGMRWARTVLAVLVVANLLVGLLSGQGPSGLLGLVALVLMFVPASNRWLAERAGEDA